MFSSVLVATNAAFAGSYHYDPNRPASLDVVLNVIGKGRFEHRKSLESLIADAYSDKISAEHHEHFRAHEMFATLDAKGRHRARTLERLGFQPHHAMLSGLLLWLAVLPDDLYQAIQGTALLDADSMSAFAKMGKKISVASKQVQNLVSDDLRPLFEIDVLVNRVTMDVDWQAERDNRTTPVLADISYEQAYNGAMNIFCTDDGSGRAPRAMAWRKFWRNRWQWSAAGSIFTNNATDKRYVLSEREFKNKFVTLNVMPDLPFEHFAGRPAKLDARASVKYEWGKVRAIYGCDLTSYIMSAFAFDGCEDSLPGMFPVGRKANAKYVGSRVAGLLEGNLPFTLDFEDFNSQHSIPAMQGVLNAWLDKHQSTLTSDQLTAGKWTVDSLKHATIYNNLPGHQGTYKAKGTLFSGWRLTSFVNTVLNKIYSDMLLSDGGRSTSLHNGDDVLIGTRNFKTAVGAIRRAQDLNIRLQPTKTAFGSIAEFLRVDHASQDGGQYATRSIATLVHSRIESGPSSDIRSALESYESRFNDFLSRTGRIDLVIAMRAKCAERLATVFGSTTSLVEKLRLTHKVCGGLAAHKDADIDTIFESVTLGDIHLDVGEVDRVRKSNGVRSYAEELVNMFGLEGQLDKFVKRLRDATINACVKKRQILAHSINKSIEQYSVYRALYKVHSYVNHHADYGKAKLVGIAIDVLHSKDNCSALQFLLRNSLDPIKALQIVV
jgi:hypothetical protein